MTTATNELGTQWAPSPSKVLHRLMRLLDFGDDDVANAIGVTKQTVYNRRTGKRGMTIENIAEIANVLSVDPQLFVGSPADAVKWVVENQPGRINGDEPTGGGIAWLPQSPDSVLSNGYNLSREQLLEAA